MKIFQWIMLSALLCSYAFALPQMQSLTTKDTWAAAKLSPQEIKQITAAVEDSANDTPESWEKELLVRRVNLGAAPGLIAQGTKLLCGGTGNCQIFVLEKKNDKWLSLFGTQEAPASEQAPVAESFQLGPAVTSGIKDLTVIANYSAESSTRAVYKFDGKVYRVAGKK
ncbi:MAG TPA: hypothetical protein VN745_01270 [Verrucomicrobiae bacterium]|nr:hypothetical protein [Verrucomicrobiae bacterium]